MRWREVQIKKKNKEKEWKEKELNIVEKLIESKQRKTKDITKISKTIFVLKSV